MLRGAESGTVACRVAYGTKNLRYAQRKNFDIIIQNAALLNEIGLPLATRFNLDADKSAILPWNEEFFGCWSGRSHPKIGSLTEDYIKDYTYFIAMREAHGLN